jgi:hypothetical protein
LSSDIPCDIKTAGSRRSESEYDGRFVVLSVADKDSVEPSPDPAACTDINATSDVFFDDGALYDVAVAGPVRFSLSLTGEDVADVSALRVFNSNRGCCLDVLETVAAAVLPGDGGGREYPVALPSSEGRLDDGPDGLGTVDEGGSAALPDEIVARRGCRFVLGGSFGAISDVVDSALAGFMP